MNKTIRYYFLDDEQHNEVVDAIDIDINDEHSAKTALKMRDELYPGCIVAVTVQEMSSV